MVGKAFLPLNLETGFLAFLISFSLSEEVLLELLEAIWAFKTTSLLDVVVSGEGVTSSFFTSSSIFCKQTSKAVWYLDLRLACLVVGSLTKGFSRAGVGSLGLPDKRITLYPGFGVPFLEVNPIDGFKDFHTGFFLNHICSRVNSLIYFFIRRVMK